MAGRRFIDDFRIELQNLEIIDFKIDSTENHSSEFNEFEINFMRMAMYKYFDRKNNAFNVLPIHFIVDRDRSMLILLAEKSPSNVVKHDLIALEVPESLYLSVSSDEFDGKMVSTFGLDICIPNTQEASVYLTSDKIAELISKYLNIPELRSKAVRKCTEVLKLRNYVIESCLKTINEFFIAKPRNVRKSIKRLYTDIEILHLDDSEVKIIQTAVQKVSEDMANGLLPYNERHAPIFEYRIDPNLNDMNIFLSDAYQNQSNISETPLRSNIDQSTTAVGTDQSTHAPSPSSSSSETVDIVANNVTGGAAEKKKKKKKKNKSKKKNNSISNKEDKVCVICMAADKDTAMIPCGHIFCGACSLKIQGTLCAMCRSPVKGVLKLFM